MARVGSLTIGALLLAFALTSAAQDWIVTNGLAYHFEKGKDYNWATAGVGFEKQLREGVRAVGGFYLNSHREWSTYLGGAWLPIAVGAWKAGVLGGGATGYGRPVTPVGGLVLSYELRSYGFNAVFIPPVASTGGVLWLQAKTRW